MRIATINLSGNVGKTTISKNMLYPRLEGASIFEIETINTGLQIKDANIKTIRSSSFKLLIDEIMLLDSAIIDVGASNIEGFIREMGELTGSHEDIDYFLIPTIKDEKVINESVKTALILSSLGIPAEKIKIVFNRFPKDEDIEDKFSVVFSSAKNTKKFTVNKKSVVFENPIYSDLNKLSISLLELNADETDYRTNLKSLGEQEQKHALTMIALKRRSISATQNLDEVFHSLFG